MSQEGPQLQSMHSEVTERQSMLVRMDDRASHEALDRTMAFRPPRKGLHQETFVIALPKRLERA